LQAYLKESVLHVRVNQTKTTVEQVRQELEALGIHVESGRYCTNILRISEYNYLNRIPAFRDGRITVQDESSCLQGYLIPMEAPADGAWRILDVCAAPGGKAMHAAERMTYQMGCQNAGLVIARDISELKVMRIQENIERMGYQNIQTQVWDARNPDTTMDGTADVVIADVPCSGLGVIGRKKDIKYRLEPEQLTELEDLQRQIVSAAVSYLKPDGYLIYSTCTLNPAENEAQVLWMQEHLGLEPVSIEQDLPEALKHEVQQQPGTDLQAGYCTLIPGLQDCDGFFLSKLKKTKQ
jgi:16S rRNA (cytosine967-C5)-methyltransferase